MVAIMGPSGCGKTTLLNCLSGLDTINDGQILIDGTDLAVLPDNARTEYRAQNMGFVFQFYNLLPVLSAVENVELPLLVSRRQAEEPRENARWRSWSGSGCGSGRTTSRPSSPVGSASG